MARGSRVLGVAGFLVAIVGGWPGEGVGAAWADDPPFVLAVTPTNGQAVLPDLSDPGLDGAVTLRVRLGRRQIRRLRRGVPADSYDDFRNPLSLLDGSFRHVGYGWDYDPRLQSLVLRPDLPMPDGQYTVTLDLGALWSRHGRRAPWGILRTSFTVGSDVHPPRVRDVSPAPNQFEVPLSAPASIVFNESIDPYTVVSGRTVFVEEVGADPPVPEDGTLVLRDDGFIVEFRPDAVAGWPPSSAIRVRLLGAGHAECVRDRVGNPLPEDYVLEFDTKAL